MRSLRPILGFLLLATLPHTAHAELVCTAQWNRIRIGLVKGLPFTADIAFSEWELFADGTQKQRHGPIFVAHVARDSAGKVVIRMPAGWTQGRSPQHGDEATDWNSTICSPEDQTTTWVTRSDAKIDSCRDVIPGLVHIHGPAFKYPIAPSKISVDNLGIKDFNGIHANGFRYASENAPNSMKIEQWLSDSMQIEMSHTETDPLNAIETLAVVLNFRSQEAQPELFQIPPELKDKVAKRSCPAQ
jgi:hypothetical protein